MSYKIALFLAIATTIFTSSLLAEGHNKLFVKYGRLNNIPPIILWSIAKTESNFNSKALNYNKNGTRDIGLMQVNSVHENNLKRQNLTLEDLYDPETNIRIASDILSQCFKKHGFNYKGLNCYNGGIKKSSYSAKVLKNIRKKRKNSYAVLIK